MRSPESSARLLRHKLF